MKGESSPFLINNIPSVEFEWASLCHLLLHLLMGTMEALTWESTLSFHGDELKNHNQVASLLLRIFTFRWLHSKEYDFLCAWILDSTTNIFCFFSNIFSYFMTDFLRLMSIFILTYFCRDFLASKNFLIFMWNWRLKKQFSVYGVWIIRCFLPLITVCSKPKSSHLNNPCAQICWTLFSIPSFDFFS